MTIKMHRLKLKKTKRILPGDLVSSDFDMNSSSPLVLILAISYIPSRDVNEVLFLLAGDQCPYEGVTLCDEYILFSRIES
jgi:hypothetical protein